MKHTFTRLGLAALLAAGLMLALPGSSMAGQRYRDGSCGRAVCPGYGQGQYGGQCPNAGQRRGGGQGRRQRLRDGSCNGGGGQGQQGRGQNGQRGRYGR